MTATLDDVTNKKPEAPAEAEAAKEPVRLAREQGLSLTGPDGLLKQLTRQPKLTRTWTCCVAVTMSTAATFAPPRTARPPSPR
jgi:hypothetical protein